MIPRPLLVCLFSLTIVTAFFSKAGAAEPAAEVTPQRRIYYFEHQLMPKWTHGSDGHFFSDLREGASKQLIDTATKIVGKDFAEKLKVTSVPDLPFVLIGFQTPREFTHCFFVLIKKENDQYRYFTLELTEDLFGDGTKAVVGEWTPEGTHRNLGGRKYSNAEAFLAEFSATAKKGTPQPPAPSASGGGKTR